MLAVIAVSVVQYRAARADPYGFRDMDNGTLAAMAAGTTYADDAKNAAMHAEVTRRGLEPLAVLETGQAIAPQLPPKLATYEWATISFTQMGQMRISGELNGREVRDSLIGQISSRTRVLVNGRPDLLVSETFERLVPIVQLGEFGQRLRVEIVYGPSGFTYQDIAVWPQYEVAPCPAGGLPEADEWSGGVYGQGEAFYVLSDGTVRQGPVVQIGELKRLSACTRGLDQVPDLIGRENVTFYYDPVTNLVTRIGN
ncbi:MAG: hypothetical protein A3J48_01915 [Candidatus Doudnabacteria bacterium RIFCSPHIGHO2_02_FULL_46_11]|uniref:Uncharacterized protein n=1 Tax=Candidatus Doudnabacteria bacterium RIFCSPHIGHO2_02_FULL_46_11 TaxID=1817832 RepID=A0A1F5P9R1_9BACT|nr:MAG: hypothetical protein A3J48_01915 [Candidatus Doudnabacteria bacterium RIFCSPHIGHO2_02_FULL_46_11]